MNAGAVAGGMDGAGLAGIIPERSAEDIFAGRVRLTFAGQDYDLPTLVIEEEEKWLARIDGQLAGVLSGVASAGNDYWRHPGAPDRGQRQAAGPALRLRPDPCAAGARRAASHGPCQRADPGRAGGVGRREPFTRHQPVRAATGQPANASDKWALARAYEFVAATYTWSAKEVRATLSYEQLIAYLDAAQERLVDAFSASVDSVRIGTIIAQDRHAAQRYDSMKARRLPRPDDRDLESQILGIAHLFPGRISRGVMPGPSA